MTQPEIYRACRAIVDATDKPPGRWMVNVMQSGQQPDVYIGYVDHVVRNSSESTMTTGTFGIHRRELMTWSASEMEFFLRQRIKETIELMAGGGGSEEGM